MIAGPGCEDAGVLTAVVSDLHLGIRTGADLARRPDIRRILLEALEPADQVVLLGDLLELRDRPIAGALETARPFLEEAGEALAGKRIVVVPGNHDHHLAEASLERRRLGGDEEPLGLEELSGPEATGSLAALARLMRPAELVLAYPGYFIRPDVYATHGHYLDCHNTVPTFECLGARAIERLIGGLPKGARKPDDYEAMLAPIYGFTFELAQSVKPALPLAKVSVGIWQRMSANGGRRGLEAKVLSGVLVPGAVAAINRTGIGPFSADLSGLALRRAGLRSMREAVARLGIEADHVLFGHTHRPGPLPGDDEGWALPGGGRLTNTGSWIFEPAFLGETADDSPYWPGVIALVADEGPPELRRLLTGFSHDELAERVSVTGPA